ncbi:ureide permease 1-like isoform X2 [Salvia miltiorrhiza]|uniref:ureide permease 1-like isoform X2 n=1 Tax=Salvia miltiorrhiza TaxID=226208 RepID=UPI0025AC2488|nr:ureide permease 1-like isoform X2 [Salvia miltiorrhiza]
MYLVESKSGAIGCMVVALVFLGTWPALLAQLERRGRLPQHTYLDYSFTNFLTAVVIAFTLGQIGHASPNTPNFFTQLSQENWGCVLMAMAGGVFLGLGNLATQYAWPFVGLSVTEVITSSLAVVLGTSMNYFLDDKMNRAEILFPGVGCFLIAVCLGSAVHSSNDADNAAKLQQLSDKHTDGAREVVVDAPDTHQDKDRLKDMEHGSSEEGKAATGSAQHLIELEHNRAIKVFGKSIWIGLSITFFAGACYALFSPAFNLATNDQWHVMRGGVPHLVVYTAFFYFSLSFFVVVSVINIILLYRPILKLPRSSIASYLKDGDGRGLAFLAGLLCGLGNGLQFVGGQAAGYAAADCVQALPLVSTFWGVVLFGEYWRSSPRTYALLVSMLLMFIVAVTVLIASSGHRRTSYSH